ncbi:hypothetical protein IEO21_10106 [Rhodonia placenta]|uniref:Uncharacterized protein n=1 Tax=Rhodonia placenta TaxID=104341 RepID=A0A8H7NTH1_9APHY|nr:hypothetical protein IEO21_10106 [Postia placenta]
MGPASASAAGCSTVSVGCHLGPSYMVACQRRELGAVWPERTVRNASTAQRVDHIVFGEAYVGQLWDRVRLRDRQAHQMRAIVVNGGAGRQRGDWTRAHRAAWLHCQPGQPRAASRAPQ